MALSSILKAVALLLVLAAVACSAPIPKEDIERARVGDIQAKLTGRWKQVLSDRQGKVSEMSGKLNLWISADLKFSSRSNNEEVASGVVSLSSEGRNIKFTFTVSDSIHKEEIGSSWVAIGKVEGDSLVVCVAEKGLPVNFDPTTSGDGRHIATYKKVDQK